MSLFNVWKRVGMLGCVCVGGGGVRETQPRVVVVVIYMLLYVVFAAVTNVTSYLPL